MLNMVLAIVFDAYPHTPDNTGILNVDTVDGLYTYVMIPIAQNESTR